MDGAIQQISLICWSWWQARGQSRNVASHGASEPHKRYERQIMFAALDPADITTIQTSLMCKPFLRHPQRPAPGADALAENVEIGIAHMVTWRLR